MVLEMCGEKADFLDRYRGKVAFNVKYHGTPKLSDSSLAALAALDGAVRESVVKFAEDGLRESWWVSMQERSRELGLGNLWSEGRSGGWLVFDMTVSYLQDLIYEVESQCKFCDLPFEKHPEGKCLFDSSVFSPTESAGLTKWNTLREFSAEVRESIQNIGESFESEVIFQLENLDDDYATGFSSSGVSGRTKADSIDKEASADGDDIDAETGSGT